MYKRCCFCIKGRTPCKLQCYEFEYEDYEPDYDKINKVNGMAKCPECGHTFKQ